MRVPVFTVCLLLALAAIGVFLTYGGRAASPATSAGAVGGIARVEPGAAPAADVRAEIEALTKRVDALTDEIARMRQSAERVPAVAAPAAEATGGFDAAHREEVFRLIAEDRDRVQVSGQVHLVKNEVVKFLADNSLDSQTFPMQSVVDVLVEARLRYGEIRRRLVPPEQNRTTGFCSERRVRGERHSTRRSRRCASGGEISWSRSSERLRPTDARRHPASSSTSEAEG